MDENEKKKPSETGGISVQTEYIFPVIKKWLYSEKEIFLREIVSNASDAVTKLKRLVSLGQVHDIDENYKITVTPDIDAGTITVSDNGIGMTGEELRKYICQIALSGAVDFIQKYEGEDGGSNGIIGHFGLGFYSSFMVSDRVDIISRSYTEEGAVMWSCSEDGQYEITEGAERETRGTDVIMHINDEEREYLQPSKLREILKKYCSFMPVEIFLCDGDKEPEPVNSTSPLWQKNSSDCTEEEYKDFYHGVFTDLRDPIFTIHIAADYPLNFRGILFFPRLNRETDSLEGQIKLYYNQVFVSDNIKEILPDYLLMLRGVIDCPELPLNVSRSYMQNNSYVLKMQNYIVKKVADKLNSLFTNEREKYEGMWNDAKLFFEYASMRDSKFFDRVKDSAIFRLTDKTYSTVSEYFGGDLEGDKIVYYTTDEVAQSRYIKLFSERGTKIAVFDNIIDTQFMTLLEGEYKNIKFRRVDAATDALTASGEEYENEKLAEIFKKFCGEKSEVKFENLASVETPLIITVSEESRRMNDMMKMYRMENNSFAPEEELTVILNPACPLIKKLGESLDETAARYLYTLALISVRPLKPDEMDALHEDSIKLLEKSL